MFWYPQFHACYLEWFERNREYSSLYTVALIFESYSKGERERGGGGGITIYFTHSLCKQQLFRRHIQMLFATILRKKIANVLQNRFEIINKLIHLIHIIIYIIITN